MIIVQLLLVSFFTLILTLAAATAAASSPSFEFLKHPKSQFAAKKRDRISLYCETNKPDSITDWYHVSEQFETRLVERSNKQYNFRYKSRLKGYYYCQSRWNNTRIISEFALIDKYSFKSRGSFLIPNPNDIINVKVPSQNTVVLVCMPENKLPVGNPDNSLTYSWHFVPFGDDLSTLDEMHSINCDKMRRIQSNYCNFITTNNGNLFIHSFDSQYRLQYQCKICHSVLKDQCVAGVRYEVDEKEKEFDEDSSSGFADPFMVDTLETDQTEVRSMEEPKIIWPRDHKSRRTVTKMVGEDLTLECASRGSPFIDVIWTKEGDKTQRILANRQLWGVLNLTNLTAKESGTYICQLNSSIMMESAAANQYIVDLIVNERPRIDSIEGDRLLYTTAGSEVATGGGVSHELQCVVTGGKYARLSWYRNGELVTQNALDVYQDPLEPKRLVFQSIDMSMNGWYQCQMIRLDGSTRTKAVYIEVRPAPTTTTTTTTTEPPLRPVDRPSISMTSESEVELRWRSQKSTKLRHYETEYEEKVASSGASGGGQKTSTKLSVFVSTTDDRDSVTKSIYILKSGLFRFRVNIIAQNQVYSGVWSDYVFLGRIEPPRNVMARALDRRTIGIIWQPVEKYYVEGYRIRVTSTSSGAIEPEIIINNRSLWWRLIQLHSVYKQYSISMNAFNGNVSSKMSEPVYVDMIDEAVLNPTLWTSNTSLLRHYIINGRSTSTPSPTSLYDSANVDDSSTDFSLINQYSPPASNSQMSADLLFIVLAIVLAIVTLILIVTISLCACRHYEKKRKAATMKEMRQLPPPGATIDRFPIKSIDRYAGSSANNFLLSQMPNGHHPHSNGFVASQQAYKTLPHHVNEFNNEQQIRHNLSQFYATTDVRRQNNSNINNYSATLGRRTLITNPHQSMMANDNVSNLGTLPRNYRMDYGNAVVAAGGSSGYELPAYSTFSRHHAKLIKQQQNRNDERNKNNSSRDDEGGSSSGGVPVYQRVPMMLDMPPPPPQPTAIRSHDYLIPNNEESRNLLEDGEEEIEEAVFRVDDAEPLPPPPPHMETFLYAKPSPIGQSNSNHLFNHQALASQSQSPPPLHQQPLASTPTQSTYVTLSSFTNQSKPTNATRFHL